MTEFFQTVLQMSLTGSYVILLMLMTRLFLRKAPKLLSYILWFVVVLRLVCPLSLESSYNIIPPLLQETGISDTQTNGQQRSIESGGGRPDLVINNEGKAEPISTLQEPLAMPTVDKTGSPGERWWIFAAYVWLGGIAVMLGSGMASILQLNRRLKNARYVEGRIYEWSGAQTPFVIGLLHPRIILPEGLGSHERGYIIKHEQIHIRRFDHLVKLAAFGVLALHWFNPLVWLALYLMDEDMEKSCDEAVIRELGSGIKREYSASLLALSTGRRFTGRSLLAFGESSTKGRIKNILNYRKPSFWAVSAAVAIVVIAVAVAGLTGNLRAQAVTERDYAEQFIGDEISGIESGASGAVIVDSEITVFEPAGRVEGLLAEPLELWRLEYRLEPDDISKIPLAGGMNAVDGKITEDSSMGKPLLLFAYEGDTPRYEGVIWSTENNLSTPAGLETELRVFLEGNGKLSHEIFSGNHALAKFIMSTGETAQLLLSQPAVHGDSGIWFVERWKDGNGNVYYNTPRTALPTAKYYAQLQAEVEQGRKQELLDPAQVAAEFVQSELNWNISKEEMDVQYPATAADFAVSPVSERLGYVSGLSLNQSILNFDNAEWLTVNEDPARLRKLGIDPEDDMPGGFYILNKYAVKDPLDLADEAQYAIIDGAELKEVGKADFVNRLDLMTEFGMLCTITTQNGKIIRVEERYLP
ncbi:MAG: M56 family metallopeptidase [Paenibacillus sp.]|nr:M56 family metallopeptidase [Paenibacillus sp.]